MAVDPFASVGILGVLAIQIGRTLREWIRNPSEKRHREIMARLDQQDEVLARQDEELKSINRKEDSTRVKLEEKGVISPDPTRGGYRAEPITRSNRLPRKLLGKEEDTKPGDDDE